MHVLTKNHQSIVIKVLVLILIDIENEKCRQLILLQIQSPPIAAHWISLRDIPIYLPKFGPIPYYG